eukprot:3284172-Prymnesium_polylepis.2
MCVTCGCACACASARRRLHVPRVYDRHGRAHGLSARDGGEARAQDRRRLHGLPAKLGQAHLRAAQRHHIAGRHDCGCHLHCGGGRLPHDDRERDLGRLSPKPRARRQGLQRGSREVAWELMSGGNLNDAPSRRRGLHACMTLTPMVCP